MSAYFLLKRCPNPNTEEIRRGLEGNLCMCTGYDNIIKSVKAAADKLNAERERI
jgi:carbon-monoxide dehydrogenase small subunit